MDAGAAASDGGPHGCFPASAIVVVVALPRVVGATGGGAMGSPDMPPWGRCPGLDLGIGLRVILWRHRWHGRVAERKLNALAPTATKPVGVVIFLKTSSRICSMCQGSG